MSASPFAMLLHTPRVAVSAHDLHTPVQALSQQKPCSQKVERHSSLPEQIAPFGLSPHRPATHTAGDKQSPSAVHEALQASTPQRYGKHGVVPGVTQAPVPLQVESNVDRLVVVGQVAGRHGVPSEYFWQAPASHLPLVPQVEASCTAHSPAGSSEFVATFEHTPNVPATHDLHAELQAVSQQTPCAQKLLRHSMAVEHDAPFSFSPHEFAAQVNGVKHWVLLVHALKQRVPLQT